MYLILFLDPAQAASFSLLLFCGIFLIIIAYFSIWTVEWVLFILFWYFYEVILNMLINLGRYHISFWYAFCGFQKSCDSFISLVCPLVFLRFSHLWNVGHRLYYQGLLILIVWLSRDFCELSKFICIQSICIICAKLGRDIHAKG
jgi:hypothetical protein